MGPKLSLETGNAFASHASSFHSHSPHEHMEYIMSWKIYVPFGDCLPMQEVLVVFFPEVTRRRGTGTGRMVV